MCRLFFSLTKFLEDANMIQNRLAWCIGVGSCCSRPVLAALAKGSLRPKGASATRRCCRSRCATTNSGADGYRVMGNCDC